jgi:DNA-binding transcriptional ArsR family regulator
VDTTALTLFGRARYKVLACLWAMRDADAVHLRELARRTGISPTATQYELRVLAATGLVLQEDASGRTLYRANRKHLIAKELEGMIRKMDATREVAAVTDDAFWARKRIAQKADYASKNLKRKSIFLSNPEIVSNLRANLHKDVNYDF